MSSSTDTAARRSRVVRDAPVRAAPVLQDLEASSDAAWRAVDPDAVAEAVARGYAEGHAQGHAEGFAAGKAAAAADAERQRAEDAAAVAAALRALADAATQVLDRRDATVAGLEDALVSGAVDLAEALVGRELEVAAAPGRDALARALRLAEGSAGILVRMHPDDVATVGEPSELAPGRELTVVPDPAVERGGCLVQVGDGCIDAQLGPALARVRQVLAR